MCAVCRRTPARGRELPHWQVRHEGPAAGSSASSASTRPRAKAGSGAAIRCATRTPSGSATLSAAWRSATRRGAGPTRHQPASGWRSATSAQIESASAGRGGPGRPRDALPRPPRGCGGDTSRSPPGTRIDGDGEASSRAARRRTCGRGGGASSMRWPRKRRIVVRRLDGDSFPRARDCLQIHEERSSAGAIFRASNAAVRGSSWRWRSRPRRPRLRMRRWQRRTAPSPAALDGAGVASVANRGQLLRPVKRGKIVATSNVRVNGCESKTNAAETWSAARGRDHLQHRRIDRWRLRLRGRGIYGSGSCAAASSRRPRTRARPAPIRRGQRAEGVAALPQKVQLGPAPAETPRSAESRRV
jgi:hypothetical protein